MVLYGFIRFLTVSHGFLRFLTFVISIRDALYLMEFIIIKIPSESSSFADYVDIKTYRFFIIISQ